MVGLKVQLQYRLMKMLAALPGPIQVAMSGSPPIEVDGQRLAPQAQLSLSLLNRRAATAMEELGPEGARLRRRRMASVFGGPPEAVGAVQDVRIRSGRMGALSGSPPEQLDAVSEVSGRSDVTLFARHYAPLGAMEPRPLLVYYHGGGFVFGDLETHDSLCRLLCRASGAHVLAVDYRLAPEHPFPAAVEDACAALAWAQANAATLGADPTRVGVGGDSAGGNLAAVVSQMSARGGGLPPALQLLIYPATDMSTRRRSRDLFSEGFFLTDREMKWFEASYLGEGSKEELQSDPRVSPLLAEDLSRLAPAIVITAGFDPLRDEGEDYARALAASGTPVLLRRYPGYIHGFVSAAGVSRRLRESVIEIAAMMGSAFALAQSPNAVASSPSLESLAAS